MSITVDQLFYSAYRDAGMVLKAQTGLDPDQTEEARQLYNRMVNAWAADGLTATHTGRLLFNIAVSQGDYTIGPSGQWEYPRVPRRVQRASIILTDQTQQPEVPMKPLTLDEWQVWTFKDQQSNWPWRFYYEYNEPLGIVHLLYVPNTAIQAALYLEESLALIDATGDAELIYADAVQEAIETNLAMRIAARYPEEAQISQDTKNLARSSLDLVRMTNKIPLRRDNDMASFAGRSNIYMGWPVGPWR